MLTSYHLSRGLPALMEQARIVLLQVWDVLLYLVSRKYEVFLFSFRMLPSRFLYASGQLRARRAFYRAVRTVPAYRDFIGPEGAGGWDGVPYTDKDTYIRKYAAEERCTGGIIPMTGTCIDESSGSTGIPYNWIRSARERHESHAFISFFTKYCYGTGGRITINAFSMGAWATGINMGEALQKNGIVKNTGPDIEKILHTLEFFGPGYTYLITGYPPFIKQLFDVARERSFPWERYTFHALVGGEGMSEGLRDYLRGGFSKVYSGYGATDLEIGIAGETPLAVAVRRLARDNTDVKQALFGDDSRLPMLFQYNPVMHHIETNDEGELIFTITRGSLLSPRIKYNIHDEGGVCRFDEMCTRLQTLGYDTADLDIENGKKQLQFPFVWVYGRKDFTISIMGANIYPEDLEHCLYADAGLAAVTRSYCQSVLEDADGGARPHFHFELTTEPTEPLRKEFGSSILKNLIALNSDFREAWHEYPDALVPEISLYRQGEGPFKNDPHKIKQARVVRTR